MVGTIFIKSLADGQLANAKATIYTCPSATQAIVRLVNYVNSGAAARTVNLYFKRSGGTSRRVSAKDLSLAAGNMVSFEHILTMEEGDELEGDASVAAEVDYIIKGVEKSAGSVSGALTNIRVSGGTTSNLLSAITFADSNRVSFGLNGSVMTAKHALNFSGGSTSENISDQIVFTNANGVTFQLNGSTMSASVQTNYLTTAMLSNAVTLSNINLSAGTTSNNLSAMVFSNANGVSFGLDGSTVTGSVAAAAGGSINFSAGTQSANLASVVFSNSNGVSFGLSAGTITASASGGGPGGGVTISSYQNVEGGASSVIAWAGNHISQAVAFQLPQNGSFSFMRFPVGMSNQQTTASTLASSANMSAERYWTFNAVVYSLGTGGSSKSLYSVASGSVGWTFQNSASIATNGTQGSYTQALSAFAEGNGTTLTTQYSISNTNYSFVSSAFTAFSASRMLDINFANSLTPGPYWLVAGYTSSSATNSNRISAATNCVVGYSNNFVFYQMNIVFAPMGATNSTSGGLMGCGSFSTAGGGTVSELPISAISSAGTNPRMIFQLLRSA